MGPPSPTPADRGAATGAAGILGAVVRRPVAVTMVMLAVGVFGLVSLSKLPLNLLPDVSYPTLTVRTEYEGAAPADVEKLVTRRVEETLAVISNLVSYRSISRAGISDVILEFAWDTPMTFAAQDVREKVDQLLPRLPQGVERPLILRFDPSLDPIVRIALYADERLGSDALYELRRVAEDEVRRQIENLPGVAAVRVRGGFEEEWRIELEEDLLKLHDVAASEVAERVSQENVNVAGGLLRDGDRESLVRTVGEITTLDELEKLVVALRDGQPIRVENLGRVVADKKERDVITRIEGTESVEIEIFKEAEANVVEVAHAVKSRLFGAEWREGVEEDDSAEGAVRAPRDPERGPRGEAVTPTVFESEGALVPVLRSVGIRTRILSDQSLFIEASVREVRDAALWGALLAIAVLFIFLRRLTPTLIIAVSIPASVIATFAPLYIAGVSLNIMSLGGLALGIGMLVDSSIVVLESITRRREAGDGISGAAVSGTREVGLAVLASTLTTVAVFLPIVFVEGIAGEFFRDQALAVVFSLLAALAVALLFIPMLASRRFDLGATAGDPPRRLLQLAPWSFGSYVSLRTIRTLPTRRGGARVAAVAALPLEIGLHLPLEFAARLLLMVAILVGLLAGALVRALSAMLRVLVAPLLWLFDRLFVGVDGLYRRGLGAALRMRFLVLAAAVALTAWAATRIPGLGVELVPKVHQGEFSVESQLEVGSPLERTDAVGRRIEGAIRDALAQEGIALSSLSSSAGVARDVIAKAGDGKHTSRVHVLLASDDDLAGVERRAIDAIRRRLAALVEVGEPVFTRPSIFTTRTSLEVEVLGSELADIHVAAERLEPRLRDLEGITDVQSSYRAGHPELVIVPDREQLAVHGLNAGSVARLVRDKIQGRVSTRVTRGDQKVEVLVRTPEEDVNERSEVLNLRVNDDGRRPISLATVATVQQRPGPAEIRRVRGQRAVVLSAEVDDLDLRGARRKIEALAAGLRAEDPALFDRVAVRVAGQSEESERSLESMIGAMLIAVFLVYIVMASQFESLVHPLVILLTIPMAGVGVVFALEAFAIEISVVVLIGVILLAGIVVNNAIVFVDCVNRRRLEGMDRDAAILEAGRLRLRPILMTTATTVLGLIPLALGLGQGAEIRAPMAITVIAGLISSTLLTLVVIPVVYSLLSRRGPLAVAAEVEA